MPSDELRAKALEALQPAYADFRSALAKTIEEVRSFLATRETSEEEHVSREQHALGGFAAGRVNPAKFAALLKNNLTVGAAAYEQVERAFATLASLADNQETLGHVQVAKGGSLRDAVAGALAQIGRAFGAAHAVRAAKGEAYEEEKHGPGLQAFPFSRWGPAERALAPPLCVEVDGTDMQAAALAEFLDGGLKIVLLVDGPCPPAALARLIAPHSFVVQATDPAALAGLVTFDGPGIAALTGEGVAQFRHDPERGHSPAERLVIESAPEEAPRRPMGGVSVAQQAEDLELLRSLTLAAHAPTAAGGSDSTDKLAAWLLGQANLKDVS